MHRNFRTQIQIELHLRGLLGSTWSAGMLHLICILQLGEQWLSGSLQRAMAHCQQRIAKKDFLGGLTTKLSDLPPAMSISDL